MSGLQGSKWAPGSRDNKPKDDKPEENSGYICVPNFGFVLPPLKPKAAAAVPTKGVSTPASPPKEAQVAPAKAVAPAPEVIKTPASPPKVLEMSDAPPMSAEPEKQLTPAEVAAAKTRARMAEIMGPRRPQATSSGVKGKGVLAPGKGEEKVSGGGEKEISEPKGDVEMNLMD